MAPPGVCTLVGIVVAKGVVEDIDGGAGKIERAALQGGVGCKGVGHDVEVAVAVRRNADAAAVLRGAVAHGEAGNQHMAVIAARKRDHAAVEFAANTVCSMSAGSLL
jgi:hypothetical protein